MNMSYVMLFIILQSGVQYMYGPKDKNQVITWSAIFGLHVTLTDSEICDIIVAVFVKIILYC
jgi:hypothetical protein